MKPSEMEAIYGEACRAASNRPTPEQAQLKIWKSIMGGFDAVDMRGGLLKWWKTEKYLPMPAELKPLAEQARRERERDKSTKKDLIRWKCPDCGIHVSGFVPQEKETPIQICRGIAREGGVCNGVMTQVYRGAA